MFYCTLLFQVALTCESHSFPVDVHNPLKQEQILCLHIMAVVKESLTETEIHSLPGVKIKKRPLWTQLFLNDSQPFPYYWMNNRKGKEKT